MPDQAGWVLFVGRNRGCEQERAKTGLNRQLYIGRNKVREARSSSIGNQNREKRAPSSVRFSGDPSIFSLPPLRLAFLRDLLERYFSLLLSTNKYLAYLPTYLPAKDYGRT